MNVLEVLGGVGAGGFSDVIGVRVLAFFILRIGFVSKNARGDRERCDVRTIQTRTWITRLRIQYRTRARSRSLDFHALPGSRPGPGSPPLAEWVGRP